MDVSEQLTFFTFHESFIEGFVLLFGKEREDSSISIAWTLKTNSASALACLCSSINCLFRDRAQPPSHMLTLKQSGSCVQPDACNLVNASHD